jgi:hypothetical protein
MATGIHQSIPNIPRQKIRILQMEIVSGVAKRPLLVLPMGDRIPKESAQLQRLQILDVNAPRNHLLDLTNLNIDW